MSNEMTPANHTHPRGNEVGEFGRNQSMVGANIGAVSIEQERAIAEAQGQLILAKKFPRDFMKAFAELMEACRMPSLANEAFYSLPKGGQTVTGPSIRLAEEIARCYGNFEYGHRELSRTPATVMEPGKSEVEVYAWDKEKNNRSIRQITVTHTIDKSGATKRIAYQKDIDDKIANVASKQIRGRILALMPKAMVASAIDECRKTLAGNNEEPVSVRVNRMVATFAKYGVTIPHLEGYLKHKLDQTTSEELVELIGVFNAIKEGQPISEYFGKPEDDDRGEGGIGNMIGDLPPAKAPEEKPPIRKAQEQAPEKEQSNGEEPPVFDDAPMMGDEPSDQDPDKFF